MRKRPLEERFHELYDIDETSGCHVWRGTKTNFGYGQIGRGGRGGGMLVAHRVGWELANGPIPDGLFVLHRCDNPPCVNPEHLFLGTQKENIADMRAKGRGFGPPHYWGEKNPAWRHGRKAKVPGGRAPLGGVRA